MTDKKKDLDHDQDQTDSLVKSERPDRDFMKSEGLCTKCHGPKRKCDRAECPQ